MELLQALPLRSNYVADILFYDAGFEPAARYRFVVAGSDRLGDPDARPIECWIVTADYNTGKVVSRFWLDKRTQLVIREEQRQDDGSLLVKTLLNPESADPPPSGIEAGGALKSGACFHWSNYHGEGHLWESFFGHRSASGSGPDSSLLLRSARCEAHAGAA